MSTTLNDITQQVLDTTDSADPRVIAQEVLAAIPDEDLRECLGAALVQYVSVRVTRTRVGVPVERPDRPKAVSSKVTAIRDNWGAFLAERVQVDGTWKRVAECSVSDVDVLASDRRARAAQHMVHAKRFEALAARMRSQHVATVSELDPADTEPLLFAA